MKVTLNNIGKKYESREDFTLRHINLEIEDKDFCVILGPSGCGKTTLLRMIAGLNSITEGDLIFGEKRVNKLASKDRDIAMVFQNYALYPHLSVYDNMAFALKLRKMPKDEIDKKVKEAAKILDLEKVLDRKPKALSGGQRQRVAFARALGEYGATSMLAGNIPGKTATISQRIAMVIQDGDYQTAGVWVGIVILIAFGIVVLMNLAFGKGMKHTKQW